MTALETAANWAAILTALVATIAYLRFVCAQWRCRERSKSTFERKSKLVRTSAGGL